LIMLSLKKLLFRGGAPSGLPEDVRASLDAWRASKAPALDDLHFHTRYVVVDIVSSGLDPDKDQLLGIAASSIWQAPSSRTTLFTSISARWTVKGQPSIAS
jgi:DNA polymerase-3 subunit epsilon